MEHQQEVLTNSIKIINRYPRKMKKKMKKSSEWQRLFGGPKYHAEKLLSPSDKYFLFGI